MNLLANRGGSGMMPPAVGVEIVFFSIGRTLVGECVDGVIQQVFLSPLSSAQQDLLTRTATESPCVL